MACGFAVCGSLPVAILATPLTCLRLKFSASPTGPRSAASEPFTKGYPCRRCRRPARPRRAQAGVARLAREPACTSFFWARPFFRRAPLGPVPALDPWFYPFNPVIRALATMKRCSRKNSSNVGRIATREAAMISSQALPCSPV